MQRANTRQRETRDEAICRLAERARLQGVQVFCYDLGRAVEFYATSTSRPGTLHRVTVFSCDCPGFIRHHRCTHHARLLDEIGELPITPSPATAAVAAPGETPVLADTVWIPIVCECCGGSGQDCVPTYTGGWRDVTCPVCDGRGQSDIEVPSDVPATLDAMTSSSIRGRQCAVCRGRGYTPMQTGPGLDGWEANACRNCQGAGLVPVPAPIPQPVELQSFDRIAPAA